MSYAILFRFNNRHSNTFFSKTVVIRRIQRSRTGYTLWLEYYSTIRIRFRFTIRPNTNSLFGALFGTETNTTRILGTALAIVSLLAVFDAAARRQCIQCCCFFLLVTTISRSELIVVLLQFTTGLETITFSKKLSLSRLFSFLNYCVFTRAVQTFTKPECKQAVVSF